MHSSLRHGHGVSYKMQHQNHMHYAAAVAFR